jgi:uncharacterized protein YyaL (SSP411 family)
MLATEQKPNRLINEKSPYLLQHARNPVDWCPWGDEAFAKSKAEDKPVFLSIGYSTCHWCHVMERESFEDNEVAEVLNAGFVAIKVDREERPDIDHIYMAVCQALTGSGGWPLTVIMTPDKKPFFAGTYFPKNSKWGRPGIIEILQAVRREWASDRQGLVENSEKIVSSLQPAKPVRAGDISAEPLRIAYEQLNSAFDKEYGGFGGPPKFPTPHNLMFLMRYWYRTGEENALRMVEKTLEAMQQGGIYDHLGYGFSRYSVDDRWLIPHFEKMLYDNALLCYTYLEAFQCTHDERYAKVAHEILHYILRDMTNSEGGFYSAEDADSEGVEGKFYAWRYEEVLRLLGREKGEVFCDYYNIKPEGNFEHGTSILNHIGYKPEKYATQNNSEELGQVLSDCRQLLFQEREKRVHPFKDDKVLTAWNGMMIAALAKSARVTGRKEYKLAAERGFRFIAENLFRSDGRLLARYRDGEANFPAYIDDYAFLIWALVELYEATFSLDYLKDALKLYAEMKRLFWDEATGGFFFYGIDSEALIARPKEYYDGAIPSGNSVAAFALLKLARLVDSQELVTLGEKAIKAFYAEALKYPRAYTFFLLALDYFLSSPRQIVIAGSTEDEITAGMLALISGRFLPTTDVLLADNIAETAELLPHVAGKIPLYGRPAAYICENYACQPPIQEMEELHKKI